MRAKIVRTLKNYIYWADEKCIELKYDKSLPTSTIGFIEPFADDEATANQPNRTRTNCSLCSQVFRRFAKSELKNFESVKK